MLKEIHEQSQSLQHCISGRLRHAEGTSVLGGLQVQPQELAQLPHVRLIGCGTALHAAQIGQILIEQWARIPAVSHVASEFNANDPVINPKRSIWRYLNQEKQPTRSQRSRKSNERERMFMAL